MKKLFLLMSLVLILVSANVLQAQSWFYSAETSQKYTEAPFAFRYYNPAIISSLSGNIGWNNDLITVSITPNYQTYSSISEYNFLANDFSISLNSTNWTGELGFNQQESFSSISGMTWYNPYAGIYYRFDTESGWWETGSTFSGMWFDGADELNQLNLNGYFEWNKSFETRTSITAGTKIGAKYFLNSSTPESYLSDSSSSSNLLSTGYSELEGNGNGSGNKNSNGMNSGTGMGSKTSTSRFQKQLAGISDSWITVSQNINSWSSLSLSGNLHFVLTAQSKNNFSNSSVLLASEWMDDNSGYNSESVQLGMNFLLPNEIALKFSGFYDWRQYSSQTAYSDQVTVSSNKRTDTKPGISISAEKYFRFGENGFTLNLTGYLQDNQSNSYWYQFSNSGLKMNLSYEF